MRLRLVSVLRFAAAPWVALCLLAQPAAAQGIFSLVRAGNWAAADAAAAALSPDPVARKLIRYFRLLTPNAASAAEIAAFMADSPDWPLPASVARRRDDALANEPDDAAALAICDPARPTIATSAARLRCADAFAHAGRAADATALIRSAWVDGPSDPVWETRQMQRFAGVITPADQWRRFERLAWSDPAGAKRQEARLDAPDRPAAEARLLLRRDDPSAFAALGALTPAQRADPGLVLEELRYLRRAGRDDEALVSWATEGAAAERAAPAERLAAFWDERNLLARRRLRAGDNAGAYALANGHAQHGAEQVADAEFLAGFIALRRLNDPAAAAPHFDAVAKVSKAAITQARAHFWLGRTAAARSDSATAAAEYRIAAAFPNTFYGQLAIVALGDGDALAARIAAARDPQADGDQALGLAGRELARAAALLVSWGEPRRAPSFLLRLADVTPDPADRALAARLAAGLGLPDIAIAIARRAGRDGIALIDTGWPLAADPPQTSGTDPALALGVIRQESSFDTSTVSPVGARGLMQLMPGTATEVARQIGITVSLAGLTADPAANMQLGTTYLHGLLDRYGDSIPLAVAAYNAGPGRVTDWLAAFGDPRTNAVDAIDWIELIPINETRNYVQRVIENTVIYRAKRGEPGAHPLAQWLR